MHVGCHPDSVFTCLYYLKFKSKAWNMLYQWAKHSHFLWNMSTDIIALQQHLKHGYGLWAPCTSPVNIPNRNTIVFVGMFACPYIGWTILTHSKITIVLLIFNFNELLRWRVVKSRSSFLCGWFETALKQLKAEKSTTQQIQDSSVNGLHLVSLETLRIMQLSSKNQHRHTRTGHNCEQQLFFLCNNFGFIF